MKRSLGLFAIVALCVACRGAGNSRPKSALSVSETQGASKAEPISAPQEREAPTEPEPGLRRAASPEERAAIATLARAAENVRQLRFHTPVRVEVEDAATITSSLIDQIEDEDIERASLVYGSLGLVDPTSDLRALFADVVGEQVVGYYDPEDDRLVVRDDVIVGLVERPGESVVDETRLVLVHELTHALQDQRLGLGETYDKERSSDEDNAYRAVVEGDATLAMLAHVLRGQGIPLSVATAGIQQMSGLVDMGTLMQGEKLEESPAILRVTLVAPYVRGLQMMAAIQARGGWQAANRAFRDPPTTTEQMLHVEKFFAREPAEVIEIPRIAALDRAKFSIVEEDTLGELEIGVYFGQGLPSETDEPAASGWAGDRLQVVARGQEVAAIWWTTWDSESEAVQAERAARRVSPSDDRARVERLGRALLIIRGLPRELHGPVRRSFVSFAQRINAKPAPRGLARALSR